MIGEYFEEGLTHIIPLKSMRNAAQGASTVIGR
jgi:hypothetical protein